MTSDREIREQVKVRDYEHVERMKKEMEEEDRQLKAFFEEEKKATGIDPTVRSTCNTRQRSRSMIIRWIPSKMSWKTSVC